MRPWTVVAIAASLGVVAGILVLTGGRRPHRGRGLDRLRTRENRTDEELAGTFPASDPVSATALLVSGAPRRPARRR